ncbi:FHA domain-containing protein [Cryptobacterium curtum]|uniref:FHA domain-containing protein n=1 Tax=Cryptobacterium curtum TaxID=84163 RepID=UPI0023550E23|nr:FHA domain-containing protein [Cryptobacterium curtum]
METCPVCNSPLEPGAAACPSCGFKLSGATQRFKPIALNETISTPLSPARPSTLTVLRGPQNQGTAYQLGTDKMNVGRSPQCDIFLNDMTVSRAHALIEATPDGYRITDDGSFNGVWINNESISEAILHDGDVVQIGAFCLRFSE